MNQSIHLSSDDEKLWLEFLQIQTWSFESLERFCNFDSRTGVRFIHEQKTKVHELYQKIFSTFVLPHYLKGEFQQSFLILLMQALESKWSPDECEQIKPFRKHLEQAYPKQAELYARFMVLMMISFSEFYESETRDRAAFNFIKRLLTFDPIALFSPQGISLVEFKKLFFVFYSHPLDLAHWLKEHHFLELISLPADQMRFSVLWVLSVFWIIYPSQKELSEVLYPVWWQSFSDLLDRRRLDDALFLYYPCYHLFNAVHREAKHRRLYNDQIVQTLERYLQTQKSNESQSTQLKLEEKKPIRVGIFVNRLVWTSVSKILISLMRCNQTYSNGALDLILYDTEIIETTASDKNAIQMVKNSGAQYVSCHSLIDDADSGYYYSRLKKSEVIRKKIQSDQIDVLISCGYNHFTTYLFTLRTAPVQVYWSHGFDSLNLENIDFRGHHGGEDPPIVFRENHWFMGFKVGMDPLFYNPTIDESLVQSVKNRFSEKTIFLGVLSSLLKLNQPQYLKVIATLLKKHERAVFLFCGAGNTPGEGPYESIKAFFENENLSHRIFFEGQVNPHVYARVIQLFLVSFPQGQGEALTEYILKGGLHLRFYSSQQNAGNCPESLEKDDLPNMLSRMFCESSLKTQVHSIEDYIQVADSMISNCLESDQADFRKVEGWEKEIEYNNRLLASEESWKSFNSFIQQVCGLQPCPTIETKNSSTQLSLEEILWFLESHKIQSVLLFLESGLHLGIQNQNSPGCQLAYELIQRGYKVFANDLNISLNQLREGTGLDAIEPLFGLPDSVQAALKIHSSFKHAPYPATKSVWRSGMIVLDESGDWSCRNEGILQAEAVYMTGEDIRKKYKASLN